MQQLLRLPNDYVLPEESAPHLRDGLGNLLSLIHLPVQVIVHRGTETARPSAAASAAGRAGAGGGRGGGDDSDGSESGGRRGLSQRDLRRRLRNMSNDQVQHTAGRHIAGVTTTHTVTTTTYKDSRPTRVNRTSSSTRH